MYDPRRHHRRTIRLKSWNYSRPGWYYVTICVKARQSLLGSIVTGRMNLNRIGRIVEEEWLKTSTIRQNIELDEYIIMPDHMHGIIIIGETESRSVGRPVGSPPREIEQDENESLALLRNSPAHRCRRFSGKACSTPSFRQATSSDGQVPDRQQCSRSGE